MAVSYNGLSLRPVQSLNITQSSEFLENGRLKKYLFSISINGKIVPNQDQSNDAKHEEIKSKVQGLIDAFKNVETPSNTFLDIQGGNGSAPIKCSPRIKSVQIQEGPWVTSADYSIQLEADQIYIGSTKVPSEDITQILAEKDENWSINYSDEEPRFITANYVVSAKAKDTTSKKGWEIAKEYVDQKISDTGNIVPNEIDSATGRTTSDKPLVNKKTKYNVSSFNGEVSAEIEFTFHNKLASPTQADYATHDQTLTVNESRESVLTSRTIEGNIVGLLSAGSGELTGAERFAHANTLWTTVKNEIETTNANKGLISKNITLDKIKGTINYNYEYIDRQNIFGGKSENISSNQTYASDIVIVNESINNVGDGPIFQNISTKKPKSKTITIDVISSTQIVPDTSAYKPDPNAILESDSVQYAPAVGKVSRTTSWIWV